MDLPKVLRELHEELANLDAAIASLERLQEVSKNRAKAPDWLADVTSPARRRRRNARKVLPTDSQ